MERNEYHSGNYDKYMSKNPLKKQMIKRLNIRIMDVLEKYIQLHGGGRPVRVLDAGCGEGFFSNLLYENLQQVEITGLEYVGEALERAKMTNNNITYLQGDIYKMPFEENAFDVVLCMEVLEHLSNPIDAVRELERVAKGLLVFTVPNEPWFCLGNLLSFKNIARLGNPKDHINHWTFGKFKDFTKEALNQKALYDTSFPWTIAYFEMSDKNT